jgi:hypothetical protein
MTMSTNSKATSHSPRSGASRSRKREGALKKMFRRIAAVFSPDARIDSGHALGEHVELPREFLDTVVHQLPRDSGRRS